MYKTCKLCSFIGEKDKFIKLTCKVCYNRIGREKYYAKTGRLPPPKLENNICTKCKIVQENFYRGKRCEKCFKEDKKQYDKSYQKENKDKVNKNNKNYKLKNKEKIKNKEKEYRIKNKEKVKKDRRSRLYKEYKRMKIKRIENPSLKIRDLLSASINHNLKKYGGSKNSYSILKFLPYSMKDLKNHLESLFEPWMNWNNWKKYNPETWKDNDQSTWVWNLDHIIPHSKFKYSSMQDEDFQKCWELSNLRPYSGKQNIIDGNRR